MARLARALLVSVAVTRAQDSDLFGLDYSPDADAESGSDGSGMVCDVPHLYAALKKANRNADDVAVCHRDFLSETSSSSSSVDDHCDDTPPALNCGLSVWARAKPLTYIKKNYEAVLCCYQLGFAPDWIIHDWIYHENDAAREILFDLALAEGSRIDQLDENEDSESDSSPGRALESANSKHPFGASLPKFTQPKTMAEWELLKAKFLERKMHPAFEALAKSHGSAAPADGAEGRKLDNSEDNGSQDADSFECNNIWDVRDEMLKVFDNAPVGAGYARGVSSGGAQGEYPGNFRDNWHDVCVERGCRSVPVYGADDQFATLCFKGVLARFDISWVAARLAKTGILNCCIDMVEYYASSDDDFEWHFVDYLSTGPNYVNSRRRVA